MIDTEKKTTDAVAMLQSGRVEEAVLLLCKVIENAPDYHKAIYFLAMANYMSGMIKEAAANIDMALSLSANPVYIKDACDIYFDLGLSYSEKNTFEEAATAFKRVLELNDQDNEALENLLSTYLKMKKPDEALAVIEDSLDAINLPATIFFNIGMAFTEQKQYDKALKMFTKADIICSDDYLTLYNIGLIHLKKEEFTEAESYFRKSIGIKPDFPEAQLNLGLVLTDINRYKEAIECYEIAINLRKDFVNCYLNMGTTYLKQNDYDKALKNFLIALELEPGNIKVLNNIGYYWHNMNDLQKAQEYFERALSIDPQNADAHFNMATVYLTAGDYKRGWEEYEWRFRRETNDTPSIPDLKKPVWQGESLKGKTLYVYPEQGFGDAIQFVRFFSQLSAMGANVIYKSISAIRPLFEINDLKAQILHYETDDSTVEYDYYIPLLSIPRVINTEITNIPLKEGYLKADSTKVEDFKQKYFDNNDYKVGIFWKGTRMILPNRHMSLEHFLPLLELEGLKLYSFQRGYGIEELHNSPYKDKISDMGSTFKDFSDTAAAMKNLDLVISIDSGIAHLAGALGHPCYLLLPYWAEWRWMHDIDYSSWYNSLRIFRQSRAGDWPELITRVVNQVKSNINNK